MEETASDATLKRDFASGGRGELLAKLIQREISEGQARPLEENLKDYAVPVRDFSFAAGPSSVLGSI
jgi:hypothetical protein